MSQTIQFHSEGVDFTLRQKAVIRNWIKQVALSRGCKTGGLNYIFCSDDGLLTINRQYLNHDYYTDIITFDYTENNRISGDIYISVERVKDNAQKFKSTFETELHRVMIHGVLHLTGLKDKTKADSEAMRKAEDKALKLIAKI